MRYETTSERVRSLRLTFRHVMDHPSGGDGSRLKQLQELISTNHLLPHSAEQEQLESDLFDAYKRERQRDQSVPA